MSEEPEQVVESPQDEEAIKQEEPVKKPKKKKENLRHGKNKDERSYADSKDILLDIARQSAKTTEVKTSVSLQKDAERNQKKIRMDAIKAEKREARLERKKKREELVREQAGKSLSEKKKIQQQMRDIKKKAFTK